MTGSLLIPYDCPPETAVLWAMKNDNLGWKEVLSELIDNSFDHKATRVEIAFPKSKAVSVCDDGSGIKDIQTLVTVGKHTPSPSTKSGRYGIGFKSAACWLWGRVKIETVHEGMRWSSLVDWEKIQNSGRWLFYQETPSPTKDRSQTNLLFEGIRNHPALDGMIEELSFIFSPALRYLGKQIIIEFRGKRRSCSPYELPPLENIIEDSFQINGKDINLRAGIVKEGHRNLRQGFIYHSGFRVIEYGSLGAKGHSISRIAGTVQLGKGWSLGKNKNVISDEDRSLLDDAIYERCSVILMRGENQAYSLALRSLTDRVEAELKAILSKGKEKRKKGASEGTVDPQETEKKRKMAAEIHKTGDIIKRASSGLKIDFLDLYDTPASIGRAEILPTYSKVTLNTLHPFISKIAKARNVEAITLAAIILFVEKALSVGDWGKRFPAMRDYDKLFDACSMLLMESSPSEQGAEKIDGKAS